MTDDAPSGLVELVRAGKTLSLGTSGDAGPRVVTVWFAASDDLTHLVWASGPEDHHSRDLARHPQVGGAVVAMQLDGLGQKVEQAGFIGSAAEVTGDDAAGAWETYAARWPQAADIVPLAALQDGTSELRLYRADVQEWVLFSQVRHPADPRQVWVPRTVPGARVGPAGQ